MIFDNASSPKMKSYLIFFGSFRSSSNANVYLSVWVSACVRFLVQIFLRFLSSLSAYSVRQTETIKTSSCFGTFLYKGE